MDIEKLANYKTKLLEKRNRLVLELEGIAVKSGPEGEYEAKYPDLGDDEEDNAQEQEVYEMDVLVESNLEEMIAKIDRALARIEAGTYGRDVQTGELIDERRLDILPEAETVV